MTGRKLVSVLTPTWGRPELLQGAIENVRAQTYRPLEHVIVSDGEDDLLRRHVEHADMLGRAPSRVAITFAQLGRNWSSYLADSFAAPPTVVAQLMAKGEYQHFLADDERMDPDHIEALVDALEDHGADFAYSKVALWRRGEGPGQSWTIGADPPQLGQITNALYRADLIRRAGLYPLGAGMVSDWAYVRRWMEAGAVWAFVDRVTLTHRVDH